MGNTNTAYTKTCIIFLTVLILAASFYVAAYQPPTKEKNIANTAPMNEPAELSYMTWDGGSNEHIYKSIFFKNTFVLVGDSGNEDTMAIYAFSENRTLLWDKFIKYSDGLARMLTITNDSNYLIAGGFYYNSTRGAYDGYLIKFDVTGKVIWQVIGNYTGSVEFRNVMYDASTGYYVVSGLEADDSYVWYFNQSGALVQSQDIAPSSYGWDRIDVATIYNSTTYAFFGYGDGPNLLKQSFIVLTSKTLTVEKYLYINDSENNEYSLSITTDSSYLYVDLSKNTQYSYLYKLAINGTILWSKGFPLYTKYVFKKIELIDGNLLGIGFQKYSNGSANATMIYLSPDGNELWNYTQRVSGKDYVYDICWNSDTTFYLWGNTTDTNDDILGIEYTTNISKPLIKIVSPENNTYINQTYVTVKWYGNSSTGIDHYEISDGGSTWTDVGLATQYNFTSLSPGTHSIFVKAVGTNGETNTTEISITVDLTPPQLNILSPSTNKYYNSENIQIAWRLSDNTGILGTYLYCDNSTPINVTGLSEYSFRFTDGIHIVTVTAMDLAGNKVQESRAFVVDTEPPQLQVNSPGKYINHSKINITWQGTDNTGIDYYNLILNNKTLTRTQNNNITLNLNDGFYNLTIQAKDKAGNTAKKTLSFCVDTQAPEISNIVVKHHEDEWIVSWNAKDNTSGIAMIKVYVDNKLVKQITNGDSVTLENLKPGTHKVKIEIYDNAGNEISKTVNVPVNQSLPWLLILGIIAGIIASVAIAILLVKRKKKSST